MLLFYIATEKREGKLSLCKTVLPTPIDDKFLERALTCLQVNNATPNARVKEMYTR